MKEQRLAMVVLLALILASSLVSLGSYRTAVAMAADDMDQALLKALAQQESDVISADTIEAFNGHLQTEALRGQAVLALDTREGFHPRAQASMTTILSLSDQRPALVLWLTAALWGFWCLRHRRRRTPDGMYGGLALLDGRFVDAEGQSVRLTPMQQQLMELLWQAPDHSLPKADICDALWPRKPDASDTLYTLVRRLKPIIERHSDLRIEAERGKSYGLKVK